MKFCSKCEIEKPPEDFSWRNKSRQIKMSWCKLCIKYYDSERQKSKVYLPRRKEVIANRKNTNREFIFRYLLENPCVDCLNNDPRVLEFDHKDGSNKYMNISEMFEYSLETIKKEIAKCEVRCANCHRIRTANQFGTWRSKFKRMDVPEITDMKTKKIACVVIDNVQII